MAIIDVLGRLVDRIMNQDNTHTFSRTTDSLEAISNAIAALGFGPGVSLWMFGHCVAGMAPSQTVITVDNLSPAMPDNLFNDEFYIAVIHNANAPGVAPEGEWCRVADWVTATQTFTTDAFTANVEEEDLLMIVHESILFGQPLARGTLDTSSATVPADSTRTEGNNYFRGHLFMATEGAARFQPRLIVEYTGAGGIFTLDPNNPLTIAPGLIDYVILPYQSQFVPAADAAINRTPADVIGNKTDAATLDDMSALAIASLVAEVKRILLRISAAALSVTIDPGGAARTDLATLWNDLGQMLAGAAGITTWPASAPPGDGVSIAEAIRQIYDDIAAVNSGFQEQADTPVNITAIVANETDVLNLAVAATRYIVRSLRLKCADPGANTVTVRLYELVNDAAIVVDSFDIDAANFGTYHSLMDMFGLPHLSGDQLQVTVQASAGGPYAVAGQYSHATAT